VIATSLAWPVEFSSVDNTCYTAWGAYRFKKRIELEQSAYLRGDRLIIECDLTVIKEPVVAEAATTVEHQTLSSDLSDNFGKLLETAEEADVTFDVQGELFPAHKLVLAARSPVFKAELYGPIGDKQRQGTITVEDMQPAIFRALLRFIYTDSLPNSMDSLDDDDNVGFYSI
jgi:speckle-type POZ protein